MDNSRTGSEIGICRLLGIVFVVLKLIGVTEVAQWSWWWVTLPFWIVPVIVFAIWAAVFVAMFIDSKT